MDLGNALAYWTQADDRARGMLSSVQVEGGAFHAFVDTRRVKKRMSMSRCRAPSRGVNAAWCASRNSSSGATSEFDFEVRFMRQPAASGPTTLRVHAGCECSDGCKNVSSRI